MRSGVVAVLVAAVAVAAVPGVADAGRRGQHKRRGHVARKVVRRAPAAWRAVGFASPVRGVPVAASPSAPSFPPPAAPADGAAPSPTPVATPRPPALPPAAASSVSVGSTEFAFTLSQPSVAAGSVRIQIDNSRAEDPHQLLVDDAGGAAVADFGVQPAHSVTARTVTLQPGAYTLVCPIANHRALGMEARLTVTG